MIGLLTVAPLSQALLEEVASQQCGGSRYVTRT